MNEPTSLNNPLPPGAVDVQLIYVPPEEQANREAYVAQKIKEYDDGRPQAPTQPARRVARFKQARPSHEPENKEDLGSLSSQERHSRKCQICHHPDREQIEGDFLMWRIPAAIVREYDVPEISLYRHAHAFNLFPLRRENLRLGLDRVIERGAQVEVSGDTIIRAIRAQACLTDDNKWLEPAKHVIFSTQPLPDTAFAVPGTGPEVRTVCLPAPPPNPELPERAQPLLIARNEVLIDSAND
jgi:hypothetical protein